jgi:hypothetical protein
MVETAAIRVGIFRPLPERSCISTSVVEERTEPMRLVVLAAGRTVATVVIQTKDRAVVVGAVVHRQKSAVVARLVETSLLPPGVAVVGGDTTTTQLTMMQVPRLVAVLKPIQVPRGRIVMVREFTRYPVGLKRVEDLPRKVVTVNQITTECTTMVTTVPPVGEAVVTAEAGAAK